MLESDVKKKEGYKNTVTIISASKIRSALSERLGFYDHAFVSAIVDAQIKTALISGVTVIYDAPDLSRETREHFADLAETAGIKTKELYIMAADIENMPDYNEGWTLISVCEKY